MLLKLCIDIPCLVWYYIVLVNLLHFDFSSFNHRTS